jgi:hypothetical protein
MRRALGAPGQKSGAPQLSWSFSVALPLGVRTVKE